MKIKTRNNLIGCVVLPIAVFVIFLLAGQIHWLFAFLIFPVVFAVDFIKRGITCPKCKKRVKLGFEWWGFPFGGVPLSKIRCANCGYDFDAVTLYNVKSSYIK